MRHEARTVRESSRGVEVNLGSRTDRASTSTIGTIDHVAAQGHQFRMSATPVTARASSPVRTSADPSAAPRRDYGRSHAMRLAFDGLLLVSAVLAAEFSAPGRVGPSAPAWFVSYALVVLALLQIRGAYQPRLRLHILDDLRMVVSTTALAAITILSLRVIVANDPQAAGQTVRQWVFAMAILALGRAMVAAAEIRARKHGHGGRVTLIVGAGKVGHLVARRLAQYPQLGLQPIGFLDAAPLANGEPAHVPILGGPFDLDEIVDTHHVEHVVVTFSNEPHEVLLRIVERCEQLGVSVSFVPRLFEKMKDKVSIESVGSIPLISVEPTNPKGWHFAIKYALDRIVGAVLLLICLPVLVATGLAVWMSSGRPIFYRQLRVGRDGRPFEMLKFRSMEPVPELPRCSHEFPPDIAPGGAEDADRRTRVGAFLRRTSLDELPQLINVVRGEMSLVGPRPERPEFVEIFATNVHRYSDRHRVKAGITGWAQVHGLRGNTSLSDRAEWDNYYIDNWSLWLDVKILLSTASALVRSRAE